jgi:hypothetical protein
VPRGFLCPGCETWFSRIPYPEKMGGRCPVCGGILTDLSLVIPPLGAESQPPKGGTRSGAARTHLTPQPPSLRGKGEVLLPSPLRGGVGGEVRPSRLAMPRETRIIHWRAVAVAVGTAALFFLTLVFGVQVWAGGETAPEQAIMPDSDIVPDGAAGASKTQPRPPRPKARPGLKKENPVPAEKNGAPVAPANRLQVALAHLPTIDQLGEEDCKWCCKGVQ